MLIFDIMKVYTNSKELQPENDFVYDPQTGILTLTEPLKPNRKWWQFWKKQDNKIVITYQNQSHSNQSV